MNAKEQAKQIIAKHYRIIELDGVQTNIFQLAVKHSIVTVIFILAAHPHGNPFNSDGKPTHSFWDEVFNELKNYKQ